MLEESKAMRAGWRQRDEISRWVGRRDIKVNVDVVEVAKLSDLQTFLLQENVVEENFRFMVRRSWSAKHRLSNHVHSSLVRVQRKSLLVLLVRIEWTARLVTQTRQIKSARDVGSLAIVWVSSLLWYWNWHADLLHHQYRVSIAKKKNGENIK